MANNDATYIKYLTELRKRLGRALLILSVIFIAFMAFANHLYGWVAIPLMRHLPEGTSMIATAVITPFFVPIKLAFYAALFVAAPLLLYQLWAFITPALYAHERKTIWPILAASCLLFYAGVAFAYFLVLPMVFKFLIATAPASIKVMPDMSEYLSFVLKLLFAFGISFQVPIVTVVLIRSGLVSEQGVKKCRPYVIVAAFVIGMLLTPPDVISQIGLAIPMWLLFELGLIVARLTGDRPAQQSTL